MARLSPTAQEAKKRGVSSRAVRAMKFRAKLKAEAAGGVPVKSKGHVTAAKEARVAQAKTLAKKNLAIRSKGKFSTELGVGATVKRLREFERQSAQELEAARQGGDTDVEWAAQRKWMAAAEQLRKSENDAPKVDALNKDQIPIGEVETIWTRAILVFRNILDSAAVRISTNPLVSQSDRVKIKELIQDEHTRALKALEKVKWEDDEDGEENAE